MNLNTISMDELYDTIYHGKPPIIERLLYSGTYLFVGAPKLGKSFLYGAVCIPHQHGNRSLELYSTQRYGSVPRFGR